MSRREGAGLMPVLVVVMVVVALGMLIIGVTS